MMNSILVYSYKTLDLSALRQNAINFSDIHGQKQIIKYYIKQSFQVIYSMKI